jgi:hypothetical protein
MTCGTKHAVLSVTLPGAQRAPRQTSTSLTQGELGSFGGAVRVDQPHETRSHTKTAVNERPPNCMGGVESTSRAPSNL